MKVISLLFALLALGASQAYGETPKEGDDMAPKVEYITIQPPFVANFGPLTTGNRLSYVKTEIALRTSNALAKTAIEYHMPFLRNEIVMLLSKQDLATMTTNEGKERVRQEALERVKAVLQQ